MGQPRALDQCRAPSQRSRYSASKKNASLAECRLKVIQPGGLGVELREERPVDPVGVAGLQEAQHEHPFAGDVGHALDLHLARTGAHARPTRRS
jgi:hypothetical protein